jgi:outer membrane protein OmpA-like peptidoglycan-associated protein
MNRSLLKGVWTVGLTGICAAALAADVQPPKPVPQEPAGFIAGGIIGGFAAGPFGAVIGAGLGTWLGNRVHRAGEANKMEAKVAALESEKAALLGDKTDLAETNRTLAQQLDQLSRSVQAAQNAKADAAMVLDGLQGDVLFRTGSAEINDDLQHEIQVLAQAVAKSPQLKVRVDGYADPRGTVDDNLKLSEARADAVRDLFLAAGVGEESLEINAYGKSKSIAEDDDGYALERRVRLTLQAAGTASVAQTAAAAQ